MSITVTVKKGFQPPPPPAEPDTVTITMTRKDAEILAHLGYGICGPFSKAGDYTVQPQESPRVIGSLGVKVYAIHQATGGRMYENSVEDFRDHVRRIAFAVNQAIHLHP